MFGIEAITPTNFHSRFRRCLGLTLVAAAAWLAASTVCRADYSVMGTAVLDGATVQISGFFGYDPETNTTCCRDIGLIGPAPYEGTYLLDVFGLRAADDVFASLSGFAADDAAVRIVFSSNFPFVTAAISSVIWAPDGNVFDDDSSAVTDDNPIGAAFCSGNCFVAAPEPTSLAILGAALGLLLFSPRPSRAPWPTTPGSTRRGHEAGARSWRARCSGGRFLTLVRNSVVGKESKPQRALVAAAPRLRQPAL